MTEKRGVESLEDGGGIRGNFIGLKRRGEDKPKGMIKRHIIYL